MPPKRTTKNTTNPTVQPPPDEATLAEALAETLASQNLDTTEVDDMPELEDIPKPDVTEQPPATLQAVAGVHLAGGNTDSPSFVARDFHPKHHENPRYENPNPNFPPSSQTAPPPPQYHYPESLLQALNMLPRKEKETGLNAIQCPMLTTTNYTAWTIKMELLLQIHEAWDTIKPGSENIGKNRKAIALIYQSIPETLLLQIGIQTKARDVWELIRTINMGAKEGR